MGSVLPARSIGHAVALILVVLLARFTYKLIKVRCHVRSFIKETGMTSPPHSFLLGHIPAMAKLLMKYPRDTAGHSIPLLLLQEYPDLREKGLVCMDSWPIANPMLAVVHPDMCAQFCQEQSMPKAPLMDLIFGRFTHKLDLVTSDGPHWKRWRSAFNPGFSNKNILSLVPAIIEEVQVFKDTLSQAADSGETFELLSPAVKAACDVIGRVVLGKRLRIQTTDSPLFNAMRRQLAAICFPETIQLWRDNPIANFKIWNNNRIMRNELIEDIRTQFDESGGAGDPKTITRLAIDVYLKENGDASSSSSSSSKGGLSPRERLLQDDDFLRVALAQIEIFLIAGHDTTASTLCYIYYLLHRYPETADRLRKEHADVLGADTPSALATITSDPSVLHRLPYTTAVIKETLRMYPAIASVRAGARSFHLVNPQTRSRFPTDGFTLMSTSQATQRLPEYWPRPDEFIPDRWLAEEGDPLRAGHGNNAFRPFEMGPRNCIGQELATVELKLMLVMTVRDLDVVPAYREGAAKLFGEAAYQSLVPNELNNRPKDGLPVRIRRRS
ncbi:P450 monooxygenase-like protein [Hapsidospora chrysogenum ATCC 11550]|uniref:p450 monooxygenase-like protein n=1 Tax=Hapsidospora chrysogenum (strain ATCC 11550 / CBS 779.69 / DSM 880 / IAM 14645 / JCM 23072 / IMI 49137) TaxID=857340 RepID=A0A086THB8_HAPC1|nr:P450 monooxygenase-like protein [Hapsidospora chrysogenum ATCC 11550]